MMKKEFKVEHVAIYKNYDNSYQVNISYFNIKTNKLRFDEAEFKTYEKTLAFVVNHTSNRKLLNLDNISTFRGSRSVAKKRKLRS